MWKEKAASFFDKIFDLVFLLYFSVIRWNLGIVLVLFNGGVLLLVEWTLTNPVTAQLICDFVFADAKIRFSHVAAHIV